MHGFNPPYGEPLPPDVFFGKFASYKSQGLNSESTNAVTYYNFLYRIMDLYMSVFEWKNLPEGCDARMLEWYLMFNGFCGFVYDPMLKKAAPKEAPKGCAIMPLMLQGEMNIYQLPREVTAYSVDPQVSMIQHLNPDNSAIIFNTNMRINPFPRLSLYAERFANITRTIDVNVSQQKMPRVVKCNEKQRLSLENAINQVQGNAFTVWADNKIDLASAELLDTDIPFVALDLNVLFHQQWNEMLTDLGIENTNTDKKERMVGNEVLGNMGDVEAARFTRLVPRKKACDEINEVLEGQGYFEDEPDALPVDVEYRSGVYIRTDKEGTIPTAGMNDASGYEEGGMVNGALQELRRFAGE